MARQCVRYRFKTRREHARTQTHQRTCADEEAEEDDGIDDEDDEEDEEEDEDEATATFAARVACMYSSKRRLRLASCLSSTAARRLMLSRSASCKNVSACSAMISKYTSLLHAF